MPYIANNSLAIGLFFQELPKLSQLFNKASTLRIKSLTVCLMILLAYCNTYAQPIYRFALPDSFSPINITEDAGFLNIIEKRAIYALSGKAIQKLHPFDYSLAQGFTATQNNRSVIIPNQNHGFTEYLWPDSLYHHPIPTNTGMLTGLDRKQYLFTGDGHALHYYNGQWQSIASQPEQGQWFADIQGEIFIMLSPSNKLLQYNAETGLDTLHTFSEAQVCTGFHLNGEQLFVAFCNKIFNLSLSDEAMPELVYEFGSPLQCIQKMLIQCDHLRLISLDSIWSLDIARQELKNYRLPLDEMEECLAVESCKDYGFWVLSNDILYLITDFPVEKYELETKSESLFQYNIRSKNYITDGSQVYVYMNQQWQLDPGKIAPHKITHDSDGNPILIFKNFAIRIYKNNAIILERLDFPASENCLDLQQLDNKWALLTDQAIYISEKSAWQKIAENTQGLFSLLIANNALCAYSKNALIDYSNDQPVDLYKSKRELKKVSYFNELFYVLDDFGQLMTYQESGLTENFTAAGLDIQDIMFTDEYLFILTHRSLLTYQFDEFGHSVLKGAMPFESETENGRLLAFHNNEISYMLDKGFYKIPDTQLMELRKPQLKVINRKSDDSLLVIHNNYWATDPDFKLIVSGEEENTSLWTKDANPNSIKNTKHAQSLIAVMQDNVFGLKIESRPYPLLSNKSRPNIMLYLLLLILIFASVFWGSSMLKS